MTLSDEDSKAIGKYASEKIAYRIYEARKCIKCDIKNPNEFTLPLAE